MSCRPHCGVSPLFVFWNGAVLAMATACEPAVPPPKGADSVATSSATDSGYESPSSLPAGTTVLVEAELADAVSASLRAATTEVRVAQYTIWDSARVQSLLVDLADAAARGVRVRVLADEEADDTPAMLEQLSAAGVETRLDSPDVTLHAKMWVIDDSAYAGSHNLSSSALSTNREVSARVTVPTAVDAMAGWFDALWDDSSVDPGTIAERGGVTPRFDDDALGAYVDCMNAAQTRLRISMYAFSWSADYRGGEVDQLLLSVLAAHGRGVDVGVLLDGSDWIVDNSINEAAIAELRAAGVPVFVANAREVVHAKAIVCDDVAVVSDANWSYSGLVLYHGVTLVLEDQSEADRLASWIEALMADGTQVE